MIRSILLVVLEIAVMLLLGGMSGVVASLDPSTLILLVLMVAVFITVNGMWRDFVHAFRVSSRNCETTMTRLKKSLYAVEFVQKALLHSTILMESYTTLQVITLFGKEENFVSVMSIVVIGFLYMALLELFLLPVHANLMKRITEYMEGDERVEKAEKE